MMKCEWEISTLYFLRLLRESKANAKKANANANLREIIVMGSH